MTGRFQLWVNALLHPKETFASEKANANWKDALINFSVIPAIVGVLIGIFIAFVIAGTSMIGQIAPLNQSQQLFNLLGGLGIAAIVVVPILFVLMAWIGGIIAAAILNFIAKLFGGQGNFLQMLYVMSLYTPLLSIVGIVLNIIPLIGGLIALVLDLYFLTLAIKEVHQLSTGKAVLTWIVLMVVAFIIVALFAFSLLALLLGTTVNSV